MDKPMSMSVKEYLMRTQSLRTNTPLKTIEAVIINQFEEANKALKDNKSVEISGFGKFIFNEKKAIKKLEKNLGYKKYYEDKLKDPQITEKQRVSTEFKLDIVNKFIEYVKPKLNELSTDNRGMEEQIGPCSRYEADDLRHFPEQEEDM